MTARLVTVCGRPRLRAPHSRDSPNPCCTPCPSPHQELCEFGYVFGIVWQVSESATTCPPPHRCAGRGGDDSMGGRYVRVPLALSAEQLTALGEGHAEEGAHTMAEPRVTA
ncbi:MAG: hypothetical protein WDW36_003486 [Sanguina aurantia]